MAVKKVGYKMIKFFEAFRLIFTWLHIGVLLIGCGFIYFSLFKSNKKS